MMMIAIEVMSCTDHKNKAKTFSSHVASYGYLILHTKTYIHMQHREVATNEL